MASMSKVKSIFVYLNNFHKNRLLVSNTISTMGLLALGDILTQYIEIKINNRTKRSDGDLKNESSFKSEFNLTRNGNYKY